MQLTDEMKSKLRIRSALRRIPETPFAHLLTTPSLCGGGNARDPKFQPQVANNPDNFQFQTTGVKNVTQTLTYQW